MKVKHKKYKRVNKKNTKRTASDWHSERMAFYGGDKIMIKETENLAATEKTNRSPLPTSLIHFSLFLNKCTYLNKERITKPQSTFQILTEGIIQETTSIKSKTQTGQFRLTATTTPLLQSQENHTNGTTWIFQLGAKRGEEKTQQNGGHNKKSL